MALDGDNVRHNLLDYIEIKLALPGQNIKAATA